MACEDCAYFMYDKFYCDKLQCHVYLADECRYYKKKTKDLKKNS